MSGVVTSTEQGRRPWACRRQPDGQHDADVVERGASGEALTDLEGGEAQHLRQRERTRPAHGTPVAVAAAEASSERDQEKEAKARQSEEGVGAQGRGEVVMPGVCEELLAVVVVRREQQVLGHVTDGDPAEGKHDDDQQLASRPHTSLHGIHRKPSTGSDRAGGSPVRPGCRTRRETTSA